MVAEGAAGIYTEELLSPVPASGRKHFQPVAGRPGSFSADATLRRLVSFRELNLIGDWPMRGKFDVIFCRNVVIYFDDATQEMVWSRFTPMMAPGATLYIGHSERVSGPAVSQLQTCGLTAYRLGGRA
ncbi:Chemotaxis protein methyltransferase [compost metagenome]